MADGHEQHLKRLRDSDPENEDHAENLRRYQALVEFHESVLADPWEVDFDDLGAAAQGLDLRTRSTKIGTNRAKQLGAQSAHLMRILDARATLEGAKLQAETNQQLVEETRQMVGQTKRLARATIGVALLTGIVAVATGVGAYLSRSQPAPPDLTPIAEAIERQCEATIASMSLANLSDLSERTGQSFDRLGDGVVIEMWANLFEACETDDAIEGIMPPLSDE